MSHWKWSGTYEENNRLDWSLMKDGPIMKYHSADTLEIDVNELEKMGYRVIDVSVANWTRENAHKKIKNDFDFPDYYGENLAAFEDCLNDLFNNKLPGLVIVFRQFDGFYKREIQFSKGLLDAIYRQSWSWLLAGNKLITLLHSDDPDLEIMEIGGFSPLWNGKEWLDSIRRK